MLLRQLRRVVVSFNPLAAGALPAREFLARLAGKKARQSNPQCAVEPDLRDGAAPPHVYVEFESGVKQTFSFEGQSVEKVMGSITQYSEQLDSAAQLKEAGLDKVVIESEC